ncbi:MAG TPA: hypothetical protein VFY71_16155 [Planctomycetota bacterium]|nr:hypothetical protein [Planctomycetota bacterium]
MNETAPTVPVAPAAGTRVRPAGYVTSLLLILPVLVLSQIAGEVVLGMRQAPMAPGAGTWVLAGIGASAAVGLVLVNARWLWVTLGSLRCALALITLAAVASVLGTLVVQRLPDQTDEDYARSFTDATGALLYNVTYRGGGVVVHPEPDVQQWLSDQEQLYGATRAREIGKEWLRDATARLRGQEIRDWTSAHDGLLRDMRATVSWLRLPETFHVAVWFKTLLALLCLSLVIAVVQRWRGA